RTGVKTPAGPVRRCARAVASRGHSGGSFMSARPAPRRSAVPLGAIAGLALAMNSGTFGQDLEKPAPGEWPMVARDYAQTRFSPLNQITPENAAKLKVAWTFETGLGKGAEAAPLVIGDT